MRENMIIKYSRISDYLYSQLKVILKMMKLKFKI